MLADVDIIREWKQGNLGISPFSHDIVQPASIDVRLTDIFRVFNNSVHTHIDPLENQEDLTKLISTHGTPFILHPGEFVLGSTVERIRLPNDIAAQVNGKSSLGRLGLMIHSTAGFVDPGFNGTLTLELSNVSTLPIKLHPRMKIGQVAFFRMDSKVSVPYGTPGLGSHYQDQVYPEPSKMWQ